MKLLKLNPETRHIHLGWLIFLLVIAVVHLLTSKLYDDPQVLGYITFASSVASILLALIAIIWAFQSSDSLSGTINTLHKATDTMTSSAETIAAKTEELREVAQAIPHAIAEVGVKVDGLREQVVQAGRTPDQEPVDKAKADLEVVAAEEEAMQASKEQHTISMQELLSRASLV